VSIGGPATLHNLDCGTLVLFQWLTIVAAILAAVSFKENLMVCCNMPCRILTAVSQYHDNIVANVLMHYLEHF